MTRATAPPDNRMGALTPPQGRLHGQSAVVTGAAFGIGRATATLFAREGARVTVTDIQDEPLLGIRVNAVAPGAIRTERVKQLPDDPGGSEYLAAIDQMHPRGRLGEPAEVASAILFLASGDASFITGAVVPVDGGYLAQ